MAAAARRRLLYASAASGAAVFFLLTLCLPHAPGAQPGGDDKDRAEKLARDISLLEPLHTRPSPPREGEWLERFHEPGQSFQQYLRDKPTLPIGQRRLLYVLPLGEFSKEQEKIVRLTAEFMGVFFNLKTSVLDRLPLDVVPAKARRTHPSQGMKQIHAGYMLDELLPPRLPADAAAMICITSSDLYPEESWNFVFGQAKFAARVGVWSLYRFGDPAGSGEAFNLCLVRMLKISTHETGHMFSLHHCTAWLCGMAGSNSLVESDRHPLELCPECTAKICWASRADPVERYRKMQAFLAAHGLADQAGVCRDSIDALQGRPVSRPAPASRDSSE